MGKTKTNLHKTGFPPLIDMHSKVLILGSMPGEKSLAEQQYYAHPQNLFWPFIAAFVGVEKPQAYEDRKALLLQNRLAVWDVCDACIRIGSLDTAILEEIPNAIDQLLQAHPNIRTILFNGQKAASLFRKYFKQQEGYQYKILASTSPANASISRERKMKDWIEALNFAMDI